ncbi:MAG TPA: ribonuclease R [Gammaproteobacteria bacterium]|nr:ribonuclease R [Gammaproteobacteria bacterium]
MKTPRSRKRGDPEAVHEAQRYEHPIPSRKFILDFLNEQGTPLAFEPLARGLGIDSERDRAALAKRLRAMIRDGQLIENRRGEFCLLERIPLVTGEVVGHRDGFGFVIPDTGPPDIYLAPRYMREVMHGDRVAVRIKGHDRRGRPEGSLVDVLERRNSEIVGRYYTESGLGFVEPDNPRLTHHIAVPPGKTAHAKPGQFVIAGILDHPTRHSLPVGEITEVLGDDTQPGIETDIAINAHGLPHRWPKAVRDEVESVPSSVAAADKRGRVDLREVPLITIDGADARDFDDAVYCEPDGAGWRLLVAIADVSHYVARSAPLDAEARNRGTSVYFPTRVIPMLPEALSNGLCSLKPKVDRLCMVCEMRVSAQGKVTGSRFYAALMRSAARLTYSEVAAILAGIDKQLLKEYQHLLQHIHNLHELYGALARIRARRGAIDFDMPDVRMEFDDNGRVQAIHEYRRNDAHRIIEECMIAANVQAAKFLHKHRIPNLYRVHDQPDPDRVDTLRLFLGTLGLKLPRRDPLEPADFSAVLRQAAGRPDEALIETVVLRTMAQAVYQPKNIGHFGLALPEYAHFTSPIRRYPDLLVHRGIRHVLEGGNARSFADGFREMERLGQECSSKERRADEATREAVDWLKCEFMLDKVGDVFDGIITGVTDFGLFVSLKGMQVEGLIHVTSLGADYYRHDPVSHRLTGERSGREYRLTDSVRVRVLRVDMAERKIDFEPADEPRGKARTKKRGRRARTA